MIISREQRFRISGYHQETVPEDSGSPLAQGLILEVEVEFEDWLEGRALRAEAFLDPGADCTMISRRWLRVQAREAGTAILTPWIDPDGLILEQVHVSIAGWRVPLGDAERPLWAFEQEYEHSEHVQLLPGYEDLLLGRDFISQHELLVVIDGVGQAFSLLAPVDPENQDRRKRILGALS